MLERPARRATHGAQLGSVAGTLLAAVVVGQVPVTVSPQVKAVCFALFIFSVGFKSGPQFFASLNRASLRPIALAVVVSLTGLLSAVLAAKLFDLDLGTAAGVLAGACTESAMIGTAGEAIGPRTVAAAAMIIAAVAAVILGSARRQPR